MTAENKDPYECKRCGTVNAWNQETCRTCGTVCGAEPIHGADPDINTVETQFDDVDADNMEPVALPNAPVASDMPTPRRRWNAFWIFLGVAIHVVAIHLGVFSIIKVFIEPDPQFKTTIEKILEAAKSGDTEKGRFLENLPETVKSKLSTVRGIIIFLLLSAPFLIGAAIGFFSRAVLEGAASMGLSAVLIPVLNGAAKLAVFWGPVNAGIGALGAYIGYRLAVRFRKTIAAPE